MGKLLDAEIKSAIGCPALVGFEICDRALGPVTFDGHAVDGNTPAVEPFADGIRPKEAGIDVAV
jgi:hypothetical protein